MAKQVFYFALIFLFSQCNAGEITGKVVKVADGDSFTILTSENKQVIIRLHGIDAPEKGQDFYQVSKDYLSGLIMHKTVRITKTTRDRYGRTVGIVMVDNINVNEAMLTTGLAWHYKVYDKKQNWAALEIKAKNSRAGIWLHNNPLPPWEFRKQKRKPQKKMPERS